MFNFGVIFVKMYIQIVFSTHLLSFFKSFQKVKIIEDCSINIHIFLKFGKICVLLYSHIFCLLFKRLGYNFFLLKIKYKKKQNKKKILMVKMKCLKILIYEFTLNKHVYYIILYAFLSCYIITLLYISMQNLCQMCILMCKLNSDSKVPFIINS